jgi:hypothetical protein
VDPWLVTVTPQKERGKISRERRRRGVIEVVLVSTSSGHNCRSVLGVSVCVGRVGGGVGIDLSASGLLGPLGGGGMWIV